MIKKLGNNEFLIQEDDDSLNSGSLQKWNLFSCKIKILGNIFEILYRPLVKYTAFVLFVIYYIKDKNDDDILNKLVNFAVGQENSLSLFIICITIILIYLIKNKRN